MPEEINLPEDMTADEARDVLREYGSTDDAQIINEDTLSTLREEISEAKEAFAAVLSEESPQSADTLSRQDMDALTEPFRDDEGDIDVDTLRQEPETQTTGGNGGSDNSGEFNANELSKGEYDTLNRLQNKRTTFKNRGMDKRASDIEAEMQELAGVDEIDTLEREVF